MAMLSFSEAAADRLLPLREKVAEGRMRGSLREPHRPSPRSGRATLLSRPPHPALRATFSHKGRRQEAATTAVEEADHGRH